MESQRRVAVKSGNGLGKDFTAAVAVLWYVHAHDPAVVLSTAPTFRQVRHVLWRQIHRLYRNAADTLGGTMLDTRWEVADDRYALGLSANDADQFQGFHCENMFVVVERGRGRRRAHLRSGGSGDDLSPIPRCCSSATPTTTSGGFHRAFHRESGIYETITMSALESPNVKASRIEIPGLTTPAWVEERRAMWGENSELFRARVMGEFPDRGEDNLIAISDIDDATYPPGEVPAATGGYEPVVLGVDVARFGIDRSVIMARRGDVVVDMQVFHGFPTTALTGQIVASARENHPQQVNVDETGLGAGVVDLLREQGFAVYGFNGAGAPVREETVCANLRAEGYWTLARRFRDHRIRIPRDAELNRRAGVAAVPVQQPGQGADGEQGEYEEPRPALAGQGRRPDAGLPGHRPHDRTPALDAGFVSVMSVRSRIFRIAGIIRMGCRRGRMSAKSCPSFKSSQS